MTRRYISTRKRNALFGIGMHRDELKQAISDNLKKEGLNFNPDEMEIDWKDDSITISGKEIKIFRSKSDLLREVESYVLSHVKGYLQDVSDSGDSSIYNFGMDLFKKSMDKITEHIISKCPHVKFEKSLANKFKIGTDEIYLYMFLDKRK